MILHRFIPVLILIVFSACRTTKNAVLPSSLDRKSEPYDHFTFQRTYPDSVFDWRAWRRMVQSTTQIAAASRNGSPCSTDIVSNTPWTLQGPSNVAGRVNSIAVKPNDENTVLVGFAGGGIFKSTNAGENWTPVFDDYPQLSIGHLTFDPSNPNIAYAGTGDVNMPSILYNGDGVYKSTDAGSNWQYLGLNQAGIISKIIVHPTNPQVIWVASMGNPYTRNEERGVYKTTNGGQTWQKVLFVSNQAGCSSLVMSAANPEILYASFWDRIRNNSESIVSGPNAKVYKSADGGNTWTQMTNGLPNYKSGRTGLAIAQQNANKVYALYIDTLSTVGSLHLTTDGGNNWAPVNVAAMEDNCGDFGWYFGKLSINPIDDNDIYFHGILLYRRLINGSWVVASGGHADSHDLQFCPSGRRYWANDGGIYRNDPTGNPMFWIKSKNLPANQVYRVAYNHHKPNEYWLGSQDNGIKKGNAQNINSWSDIFAADGFNCAFHPTAPDTFWVESQNGNVHRTDNNGANWISTGTAFGSTDRVNWDAPYLRSIHPPYKFYAATYRLMTSPDGSSFGPNSADLTDGVILAPRFHTVSYVSESPITEGKIFVGTTDANVWRREQNGTWANITGSLPTRYVTSVIGSPTNVQRIFVTHSGFRDNDRIAHIHRSNDNGATWTDITGDLPSVPVNQIFVVPGQADSVLVAATDAGAFATKNGGVKWYQLGNNMPSVPVFDFKHNLVNKQLVAGTHGRGVWTFPIDSIAKVFTPPAVTVAASGVIKDFADLGVVKTSFPTLSLTTKTDTSGSYQLAGLMGCKETVFKPYRNDDPTNGVTVYDLVLISRHILNLEPITSPYVMVAADANKSKTITTFDIVQLRKLILGSDTAFVGNTSWRFIPKSFQFSGQGNPLLDTFPEQISIYLDQAPVVVPQFRAIKIGDLNQDASPKLSGDTEDRMVPQWPVFAQWTALLKDADISIPITLDRKTLSGIQFTIQFDPTVLEWQTPSQLLSGIVMEEHFNLQNIASGIVSFVYEFDPNFDSPNGPLFALNFKTLRTSELRNALHINSLLTPSMAFEQSGTPFQPNLYWLLDSKNHLELYPNPAGAAGAWVRSSQSGRISVWDISGRKNMSVDIQADIPVRLTGLKAGVYQILLEETGEVLRLVVL